MSRSTGLWLCLVAAISGAPIALALLEECLPSLVATHASRIALGGASLVLGLYVATKCFLFLVVPYQVRVISTLITVVAFGTYGMSTSVLALALVELEFAGNKLHMSFGQSWPMSLAVFVVGNTTLCYLVSQFVRFWPRPHS